MRPSHRITGGLGIPRSEPPIFLWPGTFANVRIEMEVEIVRETIRQHAIPRSTIAKLSGLWLTDLSAWLNGKRDIAPDRIARVQEAVTDILNVLAVFPYADLRDPDKVRKMIVAVNDAILQHGLFDEPA